MSFGQISIDRTLENKGESRLVLALAAMFHDEFSIEWLMELCGARVTVIITVLEEETGRGKMHRTGPGSYAITGESERKKYLALISEKERNRFHAKIASLLTRELPEDDNKAINLSSHLVFMENDMAGCRYLVRAGDIYRKKFMNEDAFQCYARALKDMSGKTGRDTDLLFSETAVKYSKVSTARHSVDKILKTLKEAFCRIEKQENIYTKSLLYMHMAKYEWLRPSYGRAIENFEKGWALARDLGDPRLLRSATIFNTFFLYWQGRFREAISSYEDSVSDIDRFPEGQFPLLAVVTVGYCYTATGQMTQGLGMFDAIRNHCLENGDLYLSAYAAGNIGSALLEARDLEGAVSHLECAIRESAEVHNYWVLMTTHLLMAFALYLKGENDECLVHMRHFLTHRKKVGVYQHPYSYHLELLWAMDEGRLEPIEGLSLKKEINSEIRSNNLYMKGTAYRFRALLMKKDNAPVEKISSALEKSIKFLGESGHLPGLGRSRLELARVCLMSGDRDRAKELTWQAREDMGDASEKQISPELLSLIGDDPHMRGTLLKEVLRIGQDIVSISSNRELLGKVLSSVNRMTGAERGALFLIDRRGKHPRLKIRASKNLTKVQIDHPDFEVSMKLIERVVNSGRGEIMEAQSSDGYEFFSSETIRSRICVPLILSGKVVGALYHDNRLLSSAFHEDDMELLTYFAAQAAFALENARANQEIKNLRAKLKMECEYYQEEDTEGLYNHHDVIGKSPAMIDILTKVEKVAETETTALILGDTGVGKEVIARMLHNMSSRRDRAFIKVHCGALPENLIASELFGHEKGAFTGAMKRKPGRFELADGGTLFLDEIGEISGDIQIRLLRVLQTREFERVGGTETITSDFRLVAATNRDLEKEVKAGRFRADLYYRLNVFPVSVPPLADRKEDIPLLAYHFLKKYSSKMGKKIEGISETVMKKLMNYTWPGNVRELENIIERGTILTRGQKLSIPDLTGEAATAEDRESAGTTLMENEKRHILWALEKTGWKIRGEGGAAKILDIHPSTLHFRMKKLGIKKD